MKLKYDFVITDMGEEKVAVPVGDNASEFHGMIRLNDSAAEIIELLKENQTMAQLISTLKERYDSEESEIQQILISFLIRLIEAGVLEGWEDTFRYVPKSV